MAINTGAPHYVQLKKAFPEVFAVNAMHQCGRDSDAREIAKRLAEAGSAVV
jgi:hypothetical protein